MRQQKSPRRQNRFFSMTVTRIEPVLKTKYKIFIDGQFAFAVYKGELSRYHIREGEELAAETFEKIRNEVILKRAKLRAMHLLEDMDRTESALREKLKLGLYPEDIIEEAVRYVKSFGYIDDARYALHFVESRKDTRSRKEIYAQLMRKGVSQEEIEQAFEAGFSRDAEQGAIRRLIIKKHLNPAQATPEELQKLYGFLSRKGFRYDDIRQVIQNYDENA